MVLILFFVSELDLNGVDSRGWEGGLYDEVYCENCPSLEYERDLSLRRESRLYGDLYEDL